MFIILNNKCLCRQRRLTNNLGSRLVNTLPLISQPGSMALIGADWWYHANTHKYDFVKLQLFSVMEILVKHCNLYNKHSIWYLILTCGIKNNINSNYLSLLMVTLANQSFKNLHLLLSPNPGKASSPQAKIAFKCPTQAHDEWFFVWSRKVVELKKNLGGCPLVFCSKHHYEKWKFSHVSHWLTKANSCSKKVMRIPKLIRLKFSCWSNTKSS